MAHMGLAFPSTTNKTSREIVGWQSANHYNEAIMSAMASQITGVSIVYSTVWSGSDQIKHQSSALLASVRGIHRWPVCPTQRANNTETVLFDDDIKYEAEIKLKICRQMFIFNWRQIPNGVIRSKWLTQQINLTYNLSNTHTLLFRVINHIDKNANIS